MDEIELAKREIEEKRQREALKLTEEEFEKFKQVREDYKPSLPDVNIILDDSVVGEYETRMSLFTTFILSEICTYVSGPSAGGKSQVMDACIDCLMPEDGVLIEGGSDKVIFEKKNEIEKAKYVEIRELNKINPMMVEILKSWGEGKEYTYERTKIQGGYSPFTLPAKPFVFSRADESASDVVVIDELRSRIVEVTVDGSQEQTESVMERQAENYENPFDIKQTDEFAKACLKYHISNMPSFDQYVNPAAGVLKSYIPTVFTTARRDFPKYLDNCNGIARFYHKDRMTANINGQETLFVTPEDVFLNHYIFGNNLIQSALRCSHNEKVMIQVIQDYGTVNKSQLQQALRKHSINVTLKVLNDHLKKLTDLGYLNVEKEGRNNIYNVSSFYNEFIIKPDFEYMVDYMKNIMRTVEHYKPYAEEYIERYCEPDKLFTRDPITGEQIDILNYDFGKPHDVGTSRLADVQENQTFVGQMTLV